MTEVLETAPSPPPVAAEANGHVPAGWEVVRQGEYQNASGDTVPYDVVQNAQGAQKMVERPVAVPDTDAADFFDGGWPTPAAATAAPNQPPANWREQLTPAEQAIQAQRDQWSAENPGKSYLTPEGPTIGPEDMARLQAEAKDYDLDSFDRKNIAESYKVIQETGAGREKELKQKYEAEGYSGEAFDKMIADKTAETVEGLKAKVIESAFPIPAEAKKREVKKINKRRDQLAAMLNRSPEEFAQLQADWQAYEDIKHTEALSDVQTEALKDDKGLKATEQRARLAADKEMLEGRNGEALEFMSQFGLEDNEDAAYLLRNFKGKIKSHKEDKDLQDADFLFASQALKQKLGELISAQNPGISQEELKAKLEEAGVHADNWLEAVDDTPYDPIADLKEFKNKQRAHELWDSRRRQAVEYLGPVVVMRTVQNMLKRQPEQAKTTPAEGGKALKIILDPRGIAANNGGHVLRRGEDLSGRDVNVYKAGILGQLEQARTYSRHQGDVMKAALLVNALAVGGAQELMGAWESLSESERAKEFKKKMFGKAAVGSLLAKQLAAKAAQKAKSGAGAAAKAAAKAAQKAKQEAKYQAGYFYLTDKEDPYGR